MRVVLLIDELPTSSAPKIVGEEAYYLNKLGVRCDVFVLKYRDNEVFPAHAKEINLVHLDESLGFISKICGWSVPSFSFFSLYHIFYPYLLSRYVSRKLDDYDVVMVHFASRAIFARKLKQRQSRLVTYYWDPISYILYEAYKNWSYLRLRFLSSLARELDKALLSNSQVVILPSRFHLKRIRRLGIEENRIRIVYPGTNTVKMVPEERGGFILAVARWELGNNPFFMVELARKLREEEVTSFKIKMVGPWKPGELLLEFLQEQRRYSLSANFEILGPRFGKQLEELYLAARCLVHTKTEAFGFTGLEAVAHGCPMLFPKESGVAELFQHGVRGCFPKEDDAEEFAKHLADLPNDKKLAWSTGYKTWKAARKHTRNSHKGASKGTIIKRKRSFYENHFWKARKNSSYIFRQGRYGK